MNAYRENSLETWVKNEQELADFAKALRAPPARNKRRIAIHIAINLLYFAFCGVSGTLEYARTGEVSSELLIFCIFVFTVVFVLTVGRWYNRRYLGMR